MQARNQLRETLGQVTFAKLVEDESCCVLQSKIGPSEDGKAA
jgi:hypothetical protein